MLVYILVGENGYDNRLELFPSRLIKFDFGIWMSTSHPTPSRFNILMSPPQDLA